MAAGYANQHSSARKPNPSQCHRGGEVKVMNKVVLYSKCVTIRDAQLEEKKQIKEGKAQGERRQDLLMEMERLKVWARPPLP